MALSVVKRSETPAGCPLTIAHHLPTDMFGVAQDAARPTLMRLTPTRNGEFATVTNQQPGRLTAAGIAALLNQLLQYYGATVTVAPTGTKIAPLLTSDVGFGLHISPTDVQIPCQAGDAATVAGFLATVLGTGANFSTP